MCRYDGCGGEGEEEGIEIVAVLCDFGGMGPFWAEPRIRTRGYGAPELADGTHRMYEGDVYSLGLSMKEFIGKGNVPGIIERMMDFDYRKRPTVDEIIEYFEGLV